MLDVSERLVLSPLPNSWVIQSLHLAPLRHETPRRPRVRVRPAISFIEDPLYCLPVGLQSANDNPSDANTIEGSRKSCCGGPTNDHTNRSSVPTLENLARLLYSTSLLPGSYRRWSVSSWPRVSTPCTQNRRLVASASPPLFRRLHRHQLAAIASCYSLGAVVAGLSCRGIGCLRRNRRSATSTGPLR